MADHAIYWVPPLYDKPCWVLLGWQEIITLPLLCGKYPWSVLHRKYHWSSEKTHIVSGLAVIRELGVGDA